MNQARLLAGIGCALLLAGCADVSRNVVFVTKASVGIDVDTTAQTASVAYDRTEGYFAPRYANQEPVAVYASVATNGAMFDRKIRQVYATGRAAEIVSTPSQAAAVPRQALYRRTSMDTAAASPAQRPAAPAGPAGQPTDKSMFFGTGTVIGFKVGMGTSTIDTFTFGYKRKEVSLIPHAPDDGDFPSVMASLDTGTAVTIQPNGSKFDVSQFFATGTAAEALAQNRTIHEQFQDEAQSRLSEYREDERHQRDYALTSLACLSELDDAGAQQVWENAGQLQLFPPSAIQRLKTAPSVAAARSIYTKEMTITDAYSKTMTGLMRGHLAYVCSLRKKT
jgi:hypothetical protein